jgi:carboxyl-terminal processing protease
MKRSGGLCTLINFYGMIMTLVLACIQLAWAESEQNKNTLPIDDVERFTTAIAQIKEYYVEPIKDDQLFENAIQGMLSGLDPHSDYLNIDDYTDLKNQTNGEFGGLGIEVGTEDGYIEVISPIDDTPAAKAGLKPGDLIIRINNKSVKDMTLREAVNLMRGAKGTSVDLTVLRKSDRSIFQVSVIREVIQIKSVKSEMLDPGYAYVRVSHFQAPTAQTMIEAIKQLKIQANGNIKGVVLDLRNNPGGLLDSAVDVTDVFLDSKQLKNKLIVYTKGRIPSADMKIYATQADILNGIPMVVLINEGSASGSEIVAGALQDQKRAIIMGTNSFGKGSVQTVLPLDEKHGIKLTTALYYTPNGRSIQAKGIEPDIQVTDMKVNSKTDTEESSLVLAILKESDLDKHLANGNIQENKTAVKPVEKTDVLVVPEQSKLGASPAAKDVKQSLATSDYQLYEALNLLKALNAMKK